jgi:hypothetical protein
MFDFGESFFALEFNFRPDSHVLAEDHWSLDVREAVAVPDNHAFEDHWQSETANLDPAVRQQLLTSTSTDVFLFPSGFGPQATDDGDDNGDIVVTGKRPPLPDWDGGGMGSGDTGGDGGGTWGGGGGGHDPSSDQDCGGAPASEWAADDPEVQAALDTASADQAGVDRAIADWDIIVTAANSHGIDPALLGAVALRETDFRNIDQPDGMGRGWFQIDLGAHPDISWAQAHDLVFAANWAANYLADNMAYLANAFPNFTPSELLQATAASYNLGPRGISGNPETIDDGSWGDNYGSNVVGMMDAFKDPETGDTPGAEEDNGGCGCGC